MPDASDPSGAKSINRIADPYGIALLIQLLKWADERRRALDPAGIVVPEEVAEFLDRRGWYHTAYYLATASVKSGKNPLELKETFKALAAGNDAMRAIAFQAIEDAWLGSRSNQKLSPPSAPNP